jgi:hypothetical protein
MGRGHLIGAALVVAAALAAAVTAAAATGLQWKVVAYGTSDATAGQAPVGYIAVTKAQEQRFWSLLTPADQAKLQAVNLQKSGVVAMFLYGMPCVSNVAVSGVSRTKTVVTIVVRYTKPPVGVAMCVRMGTPYALVGVSRTALGRPAPTHVRVVAVARA